MGVGSVGSDNKPKVDPQPKPDNKPGVAANPEIKDPNATDPGQRIRAPSDEYRAAAAPPPAPVKLDSAPQAAPAADAGGSHLFGLAPSGSQIAESAARISAFAQTVSIGQPIDNGGGAAAHAWDNVVVQDFSGGKDTEGKCLVADGPNGPQLVRNAFYGKYLEGINHVKLGAPLDKEHWDNGQVVQNFEHGRMTWTAQTGALVEVAGARQDAGQLVDGVYREVLGREADPGGRTTWTNWVEAHRAEGQSDPEIRQGLVEKFKQSEEYRRTHGNNPEPPPVDPGGPVVGPTGINPAPAFRSLYQPYEVANGVKVPSRVGVHWGPETSYSNVGRINDVADRLKSQGVGFATVIVNSENVQGQAPAIKALLDRGIQPVVRLLPGNQYDKTMDHLSEDEMKSMADAAGQLRQMGVKILQLDNEPNWKEGGKDIYAKLNDPNRQGEYRQTMDRYAANLAHTMDLINQKAPGMAIGWGSFSPNQAGWDRMWGDLVHRMKAQNDARGGQLLKNTFISTHPYTTGGSDGIMGVDGADWLRRNASEVLGFPIHSLATEGGNPTDNPGQQQISSDICMGELRRMAKNPNETQAFWIVADAYLKGESGGVWERHSFIDAGGGESIFFQNMRKVAQGEIRQ